MSKLPGVASVKIKITLAENNLMLNIKNTRNPILKKEQNYTKGIGLSNVKKRLDLMYPDKYILSIEDGDESFLVNLKLQLED